MESHGTAVLFGFLIAAAVILLVMAAIAKSTHEPSIAQTIVQPRGYRLRRGWLWALAAVAVVAFAISLPSFPYGNAATLSGPHFAIVAMQYGFQTPQSVPSHTPIVFDVSSRDVNHGFGIYDPAGHLIAQVQAMPEYVNHLPITFARPGHYLVRCLEYCGIAHASMQGGFDVQ